MVKRMKFKNQVTKGCVNMIPIKLLTNVIRKKVFSSYLGIEIMGNLNFLCLSLFLKCLAITFVIRFLKLILLRNKNYHKNKWMEQGVKMAEE